MDSGSSKQRALPAARELLTETGARLDEIASELRKRPVLRGAIWRLAGDIEAQLHDINHGAGLEDGSSLEDQERVAREEVAEVARFHSNRLPIRAECRERLIEVAMLDHKWAVEAYEARIAESEPQAPADADELKLAEIVAARTNIDKERQAAEELGGDAERAALDGLDEKTVRLQQRVLEVIRRHKIDPISAAEAVLGTEAI